MNAFDGVQIARQSWAYRNLIGEDLGEQWTPTLTFATPGDLAVTYSQRHGRHIRFGRLMWAWWRILTSVFTHSTATGNLRITGLPVRSRNVSESFYIGSTTWQGITKANYTQMTPYTTPDTTYILLRADGSAQTFATISVGDVPTGGTVNLVGFVLYEVEAP